MEEFPLLLSISGREWRSVLKSVRDPDLAPAPLTPLTALGDAVHQCGEDEGRVAEALRAILRGLTPAAPADLASAFILCCKVLDVSPGPREVIRDSSLLAEQLPKAPYNMELEPVLELLLWELSKLGPDLGVEVYVPKKEEEVALSFLQWLQQLARYLLLSI